MRYVVHALDKKDSLAIRKANRDQHVKYVNNQPSVDLLLAGPLMNKNFDEPIGTVLIIETNNREIAEKFVKNDPYYAAELFETVDVTEINITVNNFS